MKNYKILVFTFLIIFTVSSCKKKSLKTELNPEKINLSNEAKQLVNADNKFGFDLFKSVVQSEEAGENIMLSPTSVALALAMTYNGAEEETKTAMEETLNLQGLSVDEINKSYQHLIDALITVDDKVTLNIANSIWYRNTFSVEQDFINTNQDYYDAEVTELDFGASSAKETINNWVADKTNDKITEIIDNISADAVMYLINAIYFKGIWHYEFNESDTEEQNFTFSDGTSEQVETMSLKADLNYSYNDLFKAVELPYGQGNYTMMLFVPKDENTVNDIVSELNVENWNNWLSDFEQTSSVNVFLPKFTFEYEKKMNELLSDLGMEIAFNEYLADFSKINPNAQLYISKVKHKTFIEVNEEGTEAAAVTSVEISLTSTGGGETGLFIRFNKPFLFAIRETTTNAVIFLGKVENPE